MSKEKSQEMVKVKAVDHIDAGEEGRHRPGDVFEIQEWRAKELAKIRAVKFTNSRKEKAAEKEASAIEKAQRPRISREKVEAFGVDKRGE